MTIGNQSERSTTSQKKACFTIPTTTKLHHQVTPIINQILPAEIIVNILKQCVPFHRVEIRKTCRSFNHAFKLIPFNYASQLVWRLYHGDLLEDVDFTIPNDDLYACESIQRALQSDVVRSSIPDDISLRGRYVLLQIVCAGPFLEGVDNICYMHGRFSDYMAKSYDEMIDAAKQAVERSLQVHELSEVPILRHLPTELFLLLTDTDSPETTTQFEMGILAPHPRATRHILQKLRDKIDSSTQERDEFDIERSIRRIISDDSFTPYFLLYPTIELKERDVFKYLGKIAVNDEIDSVIVEALEKNEIALDQPMNQWICWLYMIHDLSAVELMLTNPLIDPTRWNNLPLRLAIRNQYVPEILRILKHPKVDVNVLCKSPFSDIWRIKDVQIINHLLQDPDFDPAINDNGIINTAAEFANWDVVNCLMNDARVQSTFNYNTMFCCGIKASSIKVLKSLAQDPRFDPKAIDHQYLCNAISCSSLEKLKWLVEDLKADPSSGDNCAIIEAAKSLRTSIVSFLLEDPRVDPSAQNNMAFYSIFKAVYPRLEYGEGYSNHSLGYSYFDDEWNYVPTSELELGQLFLKDSRVLQKLKEMHPNLPNYGLQGSLFEKYL